MSREFKLDRIGQLDPQPVKPVADKLEDAMNGVGSASGDAMAPAASTGESKASEAEKTPTLTDHFEKTWSDKRGGTTYNYFRNPVSLRENTIRIDPKTGNAVAHDDAKNGLLDHDGELRGTVVGNDPENGRYHKDKYITKGSVSLADDAAHPAFGDLVEANKKGQKVVALQGTLQDPNVKNYLDSSSLFIDGTTYQEDVHQGNVGDCYFLAALLQIIHYDPSKIVQMMSLAGDEVTTTFYHREGTGEESSWKPTIIKTKLGLIARDNCNTEHPEYFYYKGSHIRLSYSPKTSLWTPQMQYSSEYEGYMLKIDKARYFQAALWVNCMEQAFSLFAQKYGQYGDGINDNENNEDRYEAISGGWSGMCLHMFYGDEASDSRRIENGAPGQDLLVSGQEMIGELLKLAQAQNGNAAQDVHIMAATLRGSAISRYIAFASSLKTELSNICLQNPDKDIASACATVDKMLQLGQEYAKNPSGKYREGESSAEVKDIRTELDKLSIELENNEAFQDLNLDSYKTFRQALGMVVEFTASNANPAGANISIYNNHAYNVDRVFFFNKDRKSLNNEDLATVLKEVDLDKSYLYMQNPHGQTTPNYHEVQTRNKNDGEFKTSLKAFLNNIQTLTVATTVNHRNEK